MPRKSLILFDPAPWLGHSETYTARLVSAFQARDYHVVLVASPEFATTAEEHVILQHTWRGAELSLLRKLSGESLILDLDYARTLRTLLLGNRFPGNSVHVLHSVSLVRRIAAKEFHSKKCFLREKIFLRLMKNQVRSGHRIVVHTAEADRYLRSQGIYSMLAPLPSLIETSYQKSASLPRKHILFLGGTRPQKGFSIGLAAVRSVDACRFSPILVTGTCGNEHDEVDDSNVIFEGRVSSKQLELLYATSSVVMLPYPEDYAFTGAASFVLQEALHFGCKVIATPWAREQSASPNLFVAEDYSLDALIAAVRSASAKHASHSHRCDHDVDGYLSLLACDNSRTN